MAYRQRLRRNREFVFTEEVSSSPIITGNPSRPISSSELAVVLDRAALEPITTTTQSIQTSAERLTERYALSLDEAWRQAINGPGEDVTNSRLLEEGPFLANIDITVDGTPGTATEDWAAFLRRRHARRLRRQAREAYQALLRDQAQDRAAANGAPAAMTVPQISMPLRDHHVHSAESTRTRGWLALVDLQSRLRTARLRSASPSARVHEYECIQHHSLPLGKPRQGMQPTNLVENMANKPIIVKSSPPSLSRADRPDGIAASGSSRQNPRDHMPGTLSQSALERSRDGRDMADEHLNGMSDGTPDRSTDSDESDESLSSSESESESDVSENTALNWDPSTTGNSGSTNPARPPHDSSLTVRGRRVVNRQAEFESGSQRNHGQRGTSHTSGDEEHGDSGDVGRTILDIIARMAASRTSVIIPVVPPPAAPEPDETPVPVTAAEILDRVDRSERLRSLAQEIIRHTPRTPSSLSRQYVGNGNVGRSSVQQYLRPPLDQPNPGPSSINLRSLPANVHEEADRDLDQARERIRSLAQLRRDMSTVRRGGWIRASAVPSASDAQDNGAIGGPAAAPGNTSVSGLNRPTPRDEAWGRRTERDSAQMRSPDETAPLLNTAVTATTVTSSSGPNANNVQGEVDEQAETKETGE